MTKSPAAIDESLSPDGDQTLRGARRGWGIRAFMIIVFLSSATTAVAAGVHWYRTTWHIPCLEIVETKLDLGAGKPDETRRGQLRLKNSGRAPLEFRVQGSCGCTELKPANGTVLPGEVQEVAVALKLASHANSERAVQITVKCNDPSRPEVQCSAVARCPGPCVVSPAFVNFGQLTRSQLASAVQLIRVTPSKQGGPLDPESISVTTRTSAFQVETERDEDVAVRVFPRPDLDQGDFFDEIEIRVGGADAPVRVPMHVQVVAPVSVVPATVFLRRQADKDVFEPVDLLLVDRRKGDPIGDVQIVDGPDTMQLETTGKTPPSILRLRLTARAGTDVPPILNLKCSGVDDPISVRIAIAN